MNYKELLSTLEEHENTEETSFIFVHSCSEDVFEMLWFLLTSKLEVSEHLTCLHAQDYLENYRIVLDKFDNEIYATLYGKNIGQYDMRRYTFLKDK
jgi:hypothetical protein